MSDQNQTLQLSTEVLLAQLDQANVENGRLRLINAQLMAQLGAVEGDEAEEDPFEE